MRSLEERFWSKVRKTDECWIWTASRTGGYGQFGFSRERGPERAHRVSWTLANGPIPEGMWVLHHCDNPPCVRPDHLFLGTQSENMKDAARKGRTNGWGSGDTAGERNTKAKITKQIAQTIRSEYRNGLLQRELAARYGISQSTVSSIVRGENWKDEGG